MSPVNVPITSLDSGIYDRLRRLAGYYMRMERRGHTLQPTALVHEAYLRVYGGSVSSVEDPRQVIYVLVRAMREILIDHARKRTALKRTLPADLEMALEDHSHSTAASVLSIHSALKEFAILDPRRATVVELRYYAGFTETEVADLLEVSRETVKRDWRFAKAWLRTRLDHPCYAPTPAARHPQQIAIARACVPYPCIAP